MKKMSKNLGVALIAGILAMGAASVSFAAENAAGVVTFIGKSLDAAKAAQDAAKVGDKEKTVASLKEVRQYTKEITGDAAGMKLQKVNQMIKKAASEAEAGDLAKTAETLGPAVAGLEEIKKGASK